MSLYDAIVLGAGGIGSAALSALARRGARVLGIERFGPAHDQGSSHGRTRMIRQAYFEHPDYVPLVLRSYELWRELEARRGERLFFESGLLEVGPADGVVVPGVVRSAQQHGLQIETLSGGEVTRRWPGFRVPDGMTGVYEPRAGYLLVEACVEAQLADAVSAGAELHTGETVIDCQPNAAEITVVTDRGRYNAVRLVITAGAWAGDWLAGGAGSHGRPSLCWPAGLNLKFEVRRKPQFWFATNSVAYRAANRSPAFLYETPGGVFYGFPEIDAGEIKVAEHSGGQRVDNPLAVSRDLDLADRERVGAFIVACLPEVSQRVTHHAVCMYTMSADEHFVVDRHPADERLAFVAGLSGHGFKFAPVLGEALADLTLDGRSELPIGFLNCRRPGLQTNNG
ncbi:MAG TPA: N-methyl-L-tryptophan oxidase [Pirellulales bacterium]|jgi:monomeric sarcosine oxidase